jgi:hypothetical protein
MTGREQRVLDLFHQNVAWMDQHEKKRVGKEKTRDLPKSKRDSCQLAVKKYDKKTEKKSVSLQLLERKLILKCQKDAKKS